MQNGVPQQSSETTWFWHIPTAKRWTCALSERFFKEKPSFFDKPAPKSNSPCLATSTRQESRSFSVWVRYFKKNRSDRARRVVHWSPCRMFHASLCTIQSKKFCGDFHCLVSTYLLCMEMTSSCLRLWSFFFGLDTNITKYQQIIVNGYRNKNHLFCEKISSHNYVATLKLIYASPARLRYRDADSRAMEEG